MQALRERHDSGGSGQFVPPEWPDAPDFEASVAGEAAVTNPIDETAVVRNEQVGAMPVRIDVIDECSEPETTRVQEAHDSGCFESGQDTNVDAEQCEKMPNETPQMLVEKKDADGYAEHTIAN